LLTRFQDVPFQCSTSVWLAAPWALSPTAQALPAEAAATPSRMSLPGPRFGPLITFQTVPFQCTARVRSTVPLEYWPTAQALCAEVALTPLSTLAPAWPPGFGLCITFHEAPFQCSTKVLVAVPLT